MARNDLIILDTILDRRSVQEGNSDLGQVFERFVLDQVLMNYDLTDEQIESGWVDGSLDGGIDGFYTLVNGHLVSDPAGHVWPRSSVEIDVFIISCKHHDTFKQATIDAILASAQELFDLTKSSQDLRGIYSNAVLLARDCFVASFRALAITNPHLRMKVIYASRGDATKLGDTVRSRGKQLVELFSELFSNVDASFATLGAAELIELYRRVKAFSLSLPFVEHLATQDGYIVLSRLADYAKFVTDDNLELRRYLFDSNVRDYLNSNNINVGIEKTLADPSSPSFWWLNNGVTVLATDAVATGKFLQVRDIQIVNGLQTTETLYRHFIRSKRVENCDKPILIKVIVSTDSSVRDKIIRATNSQSAVEVAALHATEPLQRNIESVLEAEDWFYERRTNYFKNAGHPSTRIVTPNFLATASIALLLKNPERAASYKPRHTRDRPAYDTVFSQHYPVQVWPVIVATMKAAEALLLTCPNLVNGIGRGTIIRKWRGTLAYLCVAASLGTYAFSVVELAKLRFDEKMLGVLQQCFDAIFPVLQDTRRFKGAAFTSACNAVSLALEVKGDCREGRRELHGAQSRDNKGRAVALTEDMLRKVSETLPQQPWKRMVHIEVGRKLGISPRTMQAAIRELIGRGVCYEQIDGVVYDRDGVEVTRDVERAAGNVQPDSVAIGSGSYEDVP